MVDLKAKLGEQKVKLTIAPKTGSGAEAGVEDGKTQYVIDSGDATVEPDPDGKSAIVNSTVLGVVTGHVVADADPGEGDVPIQDTFTIEFVAPLAEDIGLTGEVIPA